MTEVLPFVLLGVVIAVAAGLVTWLTMLSFRAPQNAAAQAVAARPPDRLVYKDGESAFRYACAYMDCTVSAGATLPAIVVDARVYGMPHPTKRLDSGNQLVMLRIPSGSGGFVVPAETAGTAGPTLKPGDLVAWRVMGHSAEIAAVGEENFGWIGLVVGTLRPEYELGSGWVGGIRFLP
ncbi:hypothetical protein [Tahibacter caeni]|uniref:hypothetical protein n=1 Tax=Tahibacter caeni TaxID=1453545 RepID=UPI0021485FA7|nr:hypothetical protein [Tahibacter caeni]